MLRAGQGHSSLSALFAVFCLARCRIFAGLVGAPTRVLAPLGPLRGSRPRMVTFSCSTLSNHVPNRFDNRPEPRAQGPANPDPLDLERRPGGALLPLARLQL